MSVCQGRLVEVADELVHLLLVMIVCRLACVHHGLGHVFALSSLAVIVCHWYLTMLNLLLGQIDLRLLVFGRLWDGKLEERYRHLIAVIHVSNLLVHFLDGIAELCRRELLIWSRETFIGLVGLSLSLGRLAWIEFTDGCVHAHRMGVLVCSRTMGL